MHAEIQLLKGLFCFVLSTAQIVRKDGIQLQALMFQLCCKEKYKKPFLGMPLIWLRKWRLLCIYLNSTSERAQIKYF